MAGEVPETGIIKGFFGLDQYRRKVVAGEKDLDKPKAFVTI